MALASLRYSEHSVVEENRSGVFIYDGSAAKFHEWEFRTGMRWSSTKDEDKAQTMNKIVEALRGDAAQIAMDLGVEELQKPTAWISCWTQ